MITSTAPTYPILRSYSPRVRLERYFESYYHGTIVTGLPMPLSPYIHYLCRNMHRSIDADTYDYGNVFCFHLLGLITLYCFTTKFLKIYLCTNIVVLANVVVIMSTMSKIWLYQLIGSILIVVVGCPKAKRLCIMHAYLFTRHKRKESRISNKETKFADDNWYGWQLIWIKHMFAK
jgi:hypothetical protein